MSNDYCEGCNPSNCGRGLCGRAALAAPQAPLTDAQVDRILSAPIPGGSAARDWFLPHDTERGLNNIRTVVREMLRAAGVKELPNAKVSRTG